MVYMYLCTCTYSTSTSTWYVCIRHMLHTCACGRIRSSSLFCHTPSERAEVLLVELHCVHEFYNYTTTYLWTNTQGEIILPSVYYEMHLYIQSTSYKYTQYKAVFLYGRREAYYIFIIASLEHFQTNKLLVIHTFWPKCEPYERGVACVYTQYSRRSFPAYVVEHVHVLCTRYTVYLCTYCSTSAYTTHYTSRDKEARSRAERSVCSLMRACVRALRA